MKQIVILLIIFLVIRFLRKRYLTGYVNRQSQAPDEGSNSGGRADERAEGEEMVLDPVCDSYIPLSTAIRAETPSGTEYFCSAECRDKFLAS